jgi:hypothetical protein
MQGNERIRGANRLTAFEVKMASQPGVLEDGAWLRLRVGAGGEKHFFVRVIIADRCVSREVIGAARGGAGAGP